jgi:hypothetical protein
MSTQVAEKDTLSPSCCRKCKTIQGRFPAFLKILEATSPGIGKPAGAFTLTALANGAGYSRQHVLQVLPKMLKARILEPVPGLAGVKAYRKTPYGTQILSRWKTAGWRP